ncbi:MAG: hypothetical protein WC788_00960 [Candidatus Paceibacterota bacterium]|jgi:hypothetical protein
MIFNKIKKIILGSSLFFAILLNAEHEASAVSISPPVIDVAVDPGVAIERSIIIDNETDKERTYSVGVMNFEMTGEEGYQKFIPVEADKNIDLAGWIRYNEDKIAVRPKSAKKFIFTINIPSDADPGGHYASIYFSTGVTEADENKESGVGIQSQINSLILLQVSGDVKESASIDNFNLEYGSMLLSSLPVKFVYRMNNQGNVHIRPKGNIEIKNIFGKRTVLLDANSKNNRILPQNIRKIESQWGDDLKYSSDPVNKFIEEVKYDFGNFAFGKYTARLDVVYGNGNGKFLSKELVFWVFPWKAILFSALFIIIILISSATLIKKYNRWIIKKHVQLAQ